MVDAFHQEEKPLRQRLKKAAGDETAAKIREQLVAMIKQHAQALDEERAKLGLPARRGFRGHTPQPK